MSKTIPEAERYLIHIKKDVSNSDTDISNYARLLEENTENLINGNITIDQFENNSPNNRRNMNVSSRVMAVLYIDRSHSSYIICGVPLLGQVRQI